MTMTLNGKLEKIDPMLVLHNETGQFHVIGPSGQKELWNVSNGAVRSVTFLETVPPRTSGGDGNYLIEKISNEIARGVGAPGSRS